MERKDILLSAQRAMLGAITPNMQAITIGYKKMPVILRVYFNTQPSEDECELVKEITTEIIADFDEKEITFIKEEIFVEKIPENLDDWLYLQHVNNPQ
jgi:hypothetical protein